MRKTRVDGGGGIRGVDEHVAETGEKEKQSCRWTSGGRVEGRMWGQVTLSSYQK